MSLSKMIRSFPDEFTYYDIKSALIKDPYHIKMNWNTETGLYILNAEHRESNDDANEPSESFEANGTIFEYLPGKTPGKLICRSFDRIENYDDARHYDLLKASIGTSDLKIFPFVDGFYIRLFYQHSSDISNGVKKSGIWRVASAKSLNAYSTHWYSNDYSLGKMFDDVATHKFGVDQLDPALCYTFLVMHPKNRIVVEVSAPQIYLARVRRLTDDDEQLLSETEQYRIALALKTDIYPGNKLPNLFDPLNNITKYGNSFDNLLKDGETLNWNECPGFTFVYRDEKVNKSRQINYNGRDYRRVLEARGNVPNMSYRYLQLMHSNDFDSIEALNATYPEFADQYEFTVNQLNELVAKVHSSYMSKYVLHRKDFRVNRQYYDIIVALHSYYVEGGEKTTRDTVRTYLMTNIGMSKLAYLLRIITQVNENRPRHSLSHSHPVNKSNKINV